MVDEESPTDSSSGVDFDISQEATDLGKKAGQKPKLVTPQEMSQTMKP